MARIQTINFSRVGKNEGCLCDRCGQYIINIVSVRYTDGLTINYGQDCFDKMYKSSKLTTYGQKLFRKAIKGLKDYQEALARWQNDPENEKCIEDFKSQQYWNNYWADRTFEEYREWMLNEFFPYRIQKAQEELKRFSKVEFAR